MPKCESRPLDWRGKPTPAARAAEAWYRAELIRAGLLPPADTDPYYVPALPHDGDGELWPAPNGEI